VLFSFDLGPSPGLTNLIERTHLAFPQFFLVFGRRHVDDDINTISVAFISENSLFV
jgi:hypothetical protein